MSVVAAKVFEDKVVMAADSILVKGWSKRNSNFAKIAGINGMIVGGVGYAQEISLTVQMQGGTPCVWAIVTPDKMPRKYKVVIIGTGWECQRIDASRYIGTVQDGEYVWHCFWDNIPTYRNVKEPVLTLFSSHQVKQERPVFC